MDKRAQNGILGLRTKICADFFREFRFFTKSASFAINGLVNT